MAIADFRERLRRAFLRSNDRQRYQVLNQGRTPGMTPMFPQVQGQGIGHNPSQSNGLAFGFPNPGLQQQPAPAVVPQMSPLNPALEPTTPQQGYFRGQKPTPSNVPDREGREFSGRYSLRGLPIYNRTV